MDLAREVVYDTGRITYKDNFSTRSDTRTEVYIVLHSTLYVWN